MSTLIAFEIYRTENISISGKNLTVRFLRRKDFEDYELRVSDEEKGETWSYSYSAETARDFASQNGEALEQQIFEILKSDVQSDSCHSQI